MELDKIIRYLESKKGERLDIRNKTYLYKLLGLEQPKSERIWDKKKKKMVTKKKFDMRPVNKKLKELGLGIKLGTKVSNNVVYWIIK